MIKQIIMSNNDCDFIDFIDDTDIEDMKDVNNIYDYNNENKYNICDKCNIHIENKYNHCCDCGYFWKDKKIHCEKCYKNGIIYFNQRGTNISFIVNKYNGYIEIFDLKNTLIYKGYVKCGKYHGHGTLFNNGEFKYFGDFKCGNYDGFGSLLNDQGNITIGFFESSNCFKKFDEIKYFRDEKVMCNICSDDYDKVELFPLCGSSVCTNSCINCINKFFNTIDCEKGATFVPNQILCPFCRNFIKDKIINSYLPKITELLLNDLKKIKNPNEIVGICIICEKHQIRELNIQCGEQNNQKDFMCEKCIDEKSMENVKNCPNCAIKVYRQGGCHWMSCKCARAWCWHCLKIMELGEKHYDVNCKYCGKGLGD